MVFEDTDVSIQIFDLDFGTAIADAGGGESIGPKDNLAAVLLFRRRVKRHRSHGKIAVDSAIECLEAEVGGKSAREEEIDVAVHGLEAVVLLRIAAKSDFHGTVDGMREAGAGHAVEFDVAVDVACDEVAVDVADDDAPFVDGAHVDVHVAGDVKDEIHFYDVAVPVMTAFAAAALFTIAAERAVNIELE